MLKFEKLTQYILYVLYVVYLIVIPIALLKIDDTGNTKTEENVSRETLYSELFHVKNVVELPNNNFIIVFENQNGYQFIWEQNDGDIYVNEIYTAIMDTKGTPKILDDEIFSIKYQGMLEK